MATYKVLQDIEAEDKFLGPLTLKQFVFGGVGLFFGYLCVFAVLKHVLFLLPVFAPPALIGIFLAVPWSKDQPTEVWVLAKARFYFKNKTKIWDQSGLEDLVTITAPKVIDKQLTNGLDQEQVRSRLKALAETIDTRGWITKNASMPVMLGQVNQDAQRLVNLGTIPKVVPDDDPNSLPDVLDSQNAEASTIDRMIENNNQLHLQQSIQRMEQARQQAQAPVLQFAPPTPAPAPYAQQTAHVPDEAIIAEQLKKKKETAELSSAHMQTLTKPAPKEPVVSAPAQEHAAPHKKPQPEMTKAADPDILELAHDSKSKPRDEVVISLH